MTGNELRQIVEKYHGRRHELTYGDWNLVADLWNLLCEVRRALLEIRRGEHAIVQKQRLKD